MLSRRSRATSDVSRSHRESTLSLEWPHAFAVVADGPLPTRVTRESMAPIDARFSYLIIDKREQGLNLLR